MQLKSNGNAIADAKLWALAAVCATVAGMMLLCGWLMPVHLRAVESTLLQRAGNGQSSLIARGLELAQAGNTQATRLILQAAQAENLADCGKLDSAVWSHSENEPLFPGGPANSIPVTAAVIRLENRNRVFDYLESTQSAAVHELLRTRSLTNTVLFPPSSSASGQAFDAAVSVCGLLVAGNHVTPGLRDAILERAALAQTHPTAQPLEEVLMDLMSLGERLTWGQLVVFVRDVDAPSTLTRLAGAARNDAAQLPELFAAVVLSREPGQVAAYLDEFSQSGLHDLAASLRFGEAGERELLRLRGRLYPTPWRGQQADTGALAPFMRGAAEISLNEPRLALAIKWFFYLSAGFLLAAAVHHLRTALADVEPPLRVRGFHLARELLFALGFLLVVVLLTEPFLAQESQRAAFAFPLRLPVAGVAAAGPVPTVKTKLMDTRSLITLLLFFVLQGLIYCACLVKLAEIRRQKVPPRVQLKLLENEDHLFDAGLYLGFAGTIICLILVSLGIIQQSLMAAYSSTSFGIIFVSAFKIFNLRPARRHLLMEVEAPNLAPSPAVPVAPSLVGAK